MVTSTLALSPGLPAAHPEDQGKGSFPLSGNPGRSLSSPGKCEGPGKRGPMERRVAAEGGSSGQGASGHRELDCLPQGVL